MKKKPLAIFLRWLMIGALLIHGCAVISPPTSLLGFSGDGYKKISA
jgi:hypothetical protein